MSKTLVGRVEELALVVQPLDRIVERLLDGAVSAPAVGPVVVPRQPDERPLERVEVRERGRVQAVAAGAVATGLQVAVVHREGDLAPVDVGEQVRVLGAAKRAVRHVPEQTNRVRLRAATLTGRGRAGSGCDPDDSG
jgi:hypothetical protein